MRKAIKYVNHLGQSVNLFGDGIYANHKEARPYMYELKNGYGRITGKEFELLSVSLGKDTADRLIDLLEVDSVSNKYGKLYIGDWYIRCKYIGLPSPEKETNTMVKVPLRFYAPSFEYTREVFQILSPEQGENADEYLDFDFDFDFDLGGDVLTKSLVKNTQLLPADFILKFKATADSVNINIGNNAYIVSYPINTGETFVLNTAEKAVYKESEKERIDLYSVSSDISDIFEKIPSGEHIASWVGDFDISLTILEHRSVAKWS